MDGRLSSGFVWKTGVVDRNHPSPHQVSQESLVGGTVQGIQRACPFLVPSEMERRDGQTARKERVGRPSMSTRGSGHRQMARPEVDSRSETAGPQGKAGGGRRSLTGSAASQGTVQKCRLLVIGRAWPQGEAWSESRWVLLQNRPAVGGVNGTVSWCAVLTVAR